MNAAEASRGTKYVRDKNTPKYSFTFLEVVSLRRLE
jgi:hypothetical protein